MIKPERAWGARLIPGPLGPMHAVASEAGIRSLLVVAEQSPGVPEVAGEAAAAHGHLARLEAELREYFDGGRHGFTVPLDARGTPFDATVWAHLREIPFGATISYERLAREVGRPRAVRAVGAANGRNPIAIVIPCHRVINKGGGLGGYGGGLERKRWLLEHEGATGGPGLFPGRPERVHAG